MLKIAKDRACFGRLLYGGEDVLDVDTGCLENSFATGREDEFEMFGSHLGMELNAANEVADGEGLVFAHGTLGKVHGAVGEFRYDVLVGLDGSKRCGDVFEYGVDGALGGERHIGIANLPSTLVY